MASYNELNALIDAYINRNGVQAITGQILNGVLKAMVEQLGRGYSIMGAAIPTTDPGTPDGPECYFASETGTYTDFDGLQVAPGELALLCYTPSDGWTKATIYEGFRQVGATIDGNVGTPSVGVSYANGVLSFDFHNMKGNTGDAAGFGTIGADITGGVGTPGVTVESSGPATAKNLQFHFTNLKGETGVTSVVATVDNTTGTPACTVSLVGQQLTLAFSGLKGAQGDTGSSVDYPFTIVNNLTTDDATQALSAAQGVVLDGKVTQLEAKVGGLATYEETQITPSWLSGNISKTDGSIITSGNYEYTIVTLNGARYVRFLGNAYKTPSAWGGGYAFYGANDVCIKSYEFEASTTNANHTQEYIVPVPEGAVTFKTAVYIGSNSDYIVVRENDFYCYLRSGYTISEIIVNLDKKVDENAVYETSYINLTENSPYFNSALSGSFVNAGTNKIEANEYTANYKIWLFQIPAGKYRLTSNANGGSTVVTVGTLSSASDLVNGHSIASAIFVNKASGYRQDIEFAEETFLFILGRTDTQVKLNYYASAGIGVETSVKEVVEGLATDVSNMFKIDLDIVIPNVVYAIVGTQLNIYNDAISLSIDKGLHSPLNYQIRWLCYKGTITERGFRYTPASGDVGNVECSCFLYDMRGVLLSQKTFTIKVLAKNALATAKNIVYFGDSLGRDAAIALYDNFHDSDRFSGTIPKMLGTKGTTKHYEAVGGYEWKSYATTGEPGYRISVSGVSSMQVGAVYSDGSHDFEVIEVNITDGNGNCLLAKNWTNPGALVMPSGTLTKVSGGGDSSVPYTGAFQESANPLWNDSTQRLDVAQYRQTLVGLGQLSSNSEKIDAVSFQFGINDNALAQDLATLRGYISDLYDAFIADNPNCIFIVGLTTSSGNDVNGCGANYGATFNYKSYQRNTYLIRKFYLTLLADFPKMRIATPNLYLDRYYGYAFSTRQVSNRCTETEQYHNNFVHPGASGYWQMADAYLACYVGVLTES